MPHLSTRIFKLCEVRTLYIFGIPHIAQNIYSFNRLLSVTFCVPGTMLADWRMKQRKKIS